MNAIVKARAREIIDVTFATEDGQVATRRVYPVIDHIIDVIPIPHGILWVQYGKPTAEWDGKLKASYSTSDAPAQDRAKAMAELAALVERRIATDVRAASERADREAVLRDAATVGEPS